MRFDVYWDATCSSENNKMKILCQYSFTQKVIGVTLNDTKRVKCVR